MAAHLAQEERGGRLGDAESQRNRQLRPIATSFWSRVRPSSICPTPRRAIRTDARALPEVRAVGRQIDIIAEAAPKRDYYYVSPLGRRLFQFALGPAALAFIGAGSKEDVLAARRMIAEHGERWPVEWLRSRGLTEWADYLARHFPSGPAAAETVIAAERVFSMATEVHATVAY